MPVRFCPRCGRLNLADFSYCPYCGEAVSRGPGIEEALAGPLRRLEEMGIPREGASARMSRYLSSLRESLDALEADMDELLAAKKQ